MRYISQAGDLVIFRFTFEKYPDLKTKALKNISNGNLVFREKKLEVIFVYMNLAFLL